VWDAQSGQPMTGPLKHSGPVIAAEFSPDGKRIVTASGDGTARVWDAQTGQPLTGPLQHASGVNAAHFSPDGKRIVTASHDGTARLWDGQSGQPLTGPLQHIFPVVSAQFSPDGKWIVTGSADANARVWDAQSGQPLTELLQHGSTVNSAQFSPDGKRILTASHDGTARVLDAQSGQPVAALLRHNSPVTSAQFSPDGERIITAWGSTARVWNARSGQPLTGPMRHGGDIASAQFSPDGKWIATASADGTARIWDSQTGQPLAEPLVHGRAVNEEHINADGTKMLVTEMRWGVNSAQFSPDGKRVVTAAVDGTARVWDVAPSPENHPDWLPQLAEAISGQALNQQGLLVPTLLNRADVINQIRQELNQAPDQDGWVVWGRWFLADPTARTVSPFSRKTVPEYIDDRMQEKTAESLEEAERMAGDNEELLGRVAEARRIATEEALQKEAAQLAGEKEMAVRLADVVNLVDVVNPGEEQSETNHGFIGENVEAGFAQSGFAPGRSHRGSMQGGWFCYKVKVLPDKAALVVCTYRDVTSAPEKFDILVNGQRIATESFTTLDNRPAGFFYREYRIPEDMTQGLGHVTLKFRARPGQFTGQLLDIHILKAAE
jgi:dipeptidyl aminopeptidase/acylaminoacyl peptidase